MTAGVDAGDHDAGLVRLGGAAHGRVNSDDDPIEARTGLHTAINQHVNDHRLLRRAQIRGWIEGVWR